MPNIGIPELVVILVVALLLFGAGRLLEVGRSIGKAVREFKRAVFSLDADDASPPEEDKPPPSRGRKKKN